MAAWIGSTDDDVLVGDACAFDDFQDTWLLGQHAACADNVGGFPFVSGDGSDVEIDEREVPLLGQEGSDGQQAERGRRCFGSDAMGYGDVVPKVVL